jgi:hypothetical protein
MAVDFKSLLSRKVEDAERPPLLPAGTYNGVVQSHEFGESSQKKTPYVRFNIALISPGEGVDPADLEGIDIGKRKFRRDYYFTEDAEFILRDFIESLGLNIKGKSFDEMIPQVINQAVIVGITQELAGGSDQSGNMVNRVGNLRGEAGQ